MNIWNSRVSTTTYTYQVLPISSTTNEYVLISSQEQVQYNFLDIFFLVFATIFSIWLACKLAFGRRRRQSQKKRKRQKGKWLKSKTYF